LAKTIGELNGWNKLAFRVTIFGGPALTLLAIPFLTVVAWPWITGVNTAVAGVPHKLDIDTYRVEESEQSRGLRSYSDDIAAEIKLELKDARLEINGKLDRLIWEARADNQTGGAARQ